MKALRTLLLLFCLANIMLCCSVAAHETESSSASSSEEEEEEFMLEEEPGARRSFSLTMLQRLLRQIKQDQRDSEAAAAILTSKRRWSAACNVGAGIPGYQCRLPQVTKNDELRHLMLNNPRSLGKRSSANAF